MCLSGAGGWGWWFGVVGVDGDGGGGGRMGMGVGHVDGGRRGILDALHRVLFSFAPIIT